MYASQRGLTLIDVMITAALMSIIVLLSIPWLQETIRNSRMIDINNELAQALKFSRNLAMERNLRVTVCKSANGVSCSDDGGWEQGWIAFTDTNHNARYETAAESRLLVRNKVEGKLTMLGDPAVQNYVSYVGRGNAESTSGMPQSGAIKTCAHNRAGTGRRLWVAPSGRVDLVTRVDCS
jgi:type IV fimbrial biogenesis protein FimT